MGGQGWLADILAGVMIATTIYCVTRIVVTRAKRRPAEHDIDAVHALMGIAMAGMLVTSLKTLPADVWAAVFGAAAVWYAWLIARSYQASRAGSGQRAPAHRHHHLPHLAMCCAMVYMLLAAPALMNSSGTMASGMGMGGSSAGTRLQFLALVLTLVLVGFIVWDIDRLSRLPRMAPALAVNPRVEAGLALARAGLASAAGLAADTTESPATGSADTEIGPGEAGGPVMPRLALCCQIAMGATMAYMLVLML